MEELGENQINFSLNVGRFLSGGKFPKTTQPTLKRMAEKAGCAIQFTRVRVGTMSRELVGNVTGELEAVDKFMDMFEEEFSV